MVPRAGLEPARSYEHWILSPRRLPIPPPWQKLITMVPAPLLITVEQGTT